jgi:hypothetical protein
MHQIRLGLISGLDISQYASPEFSWSKMQKIRNSLDN